MRRFAGTIAIGALVQAVTLAVWAVPPPGTYERWQQQAGEHLNIRVVRVEQVLSTKGKIEIEAEAAITKIHRSKSQLAMGNLIVIQYSQQSKGLPVIPGPGDPITLAIEEHYEVYLDKSDRVEGFKPAAAIRSFHKLEHSELLRSIESFTAQKARLQAEMDLLAKETEPLETANDGSAEKDAEYTSRDRKMKRLELLHSRAAVRLKELQDQLSAQRAEDEGEVRPQLPAGAGGESASGSTDD